VGVAGRHRGVAGRSLANLPGCAVVPAGTGNTEASVGSEICRSGSTTGWECGEIEATDETVQYPEGTVHGLTRTSACAEPGDSGGSWLAGTEAQGVTSGGSGNCSIGGTTFFQPLDRFNERWEELSRNPSWSFHGPEFPSLDELLEARNRIVARHPETQFIGAHLLPASRLRNAPLVHL
jgi:hypothetical protein